MSFLIISSGCGSDTAETETVEETISEIIYGVSSAIDASGDVYVAGKVEMDRDGNSAIGKADILLAKYDNQGNKLWSIIVGTAEDDFVQDSAVSSSGELYLTGYTYGALDGLTSMGAVDMFLMKFNSNGALLDKKQIGTGQSDYSVGIAIDTADNVYLAGHTYGSMQGAISGSKDMVLIKYDASFNEQWIRQLGNNEGSEALPKYGTYAADISTDTSGGIYVAGFTTGEFDGNTNIGGFDLFVVKYDMTGAKIWSKQLGSTDTDYAKSITVDSSGDILLTGYTYGSLSGFTNAGYYDFFIIKLTGVGMPVWTNQMGTEESDYIYGVAVDQFDDVYLAGHTLGSLEGTSAGNADQILVKFNSSGSHLFTRQTGTGYTEWTYDLCSGQSSDIIVTGYGFKDIDTDDVVEQVLTLKKYDASGDIQWEKEL